ncbi:aminomethyl-transferring glycine dehydrogenase subunit GcvPA [Spirochaetota bacterium]
MPFIANTDSDRKAMLEAIGLKTMAELFVDLPKEKSYPKLDLPDGLSELEVLREIESMAAKNLNATSSAWFLGAGAYNHFIPAVVPAMASRGEFLTSYTPYQPEVSQGTLQAIFEYQSMAAELFGMDMVNASHYDGATALAEAVIMALNHGGSARRKLLLPAAMHPEYKAVMHTYLTAYDAKVEEYTEEPAKAAAKAGADCAAFVAFYPDFEGRIHDLSGIADTVHAAGAIFIVSTDPIMLGLFKSPGAYGADIVTAEGQPLGNAMNYGGPFLGMMGAVQKFVRKIPGRIVGQAADAEGKRGFVLTLSAREQHIRREKAVSNICSNQGLVMLQAAIYMEALGKHGLKAVAQLCWDKSHYAASELNKIPGFKVADGLFFKEFVVKTPIAARQIVEKLEKRSIVPGLALSHYYPERSHELLVCVTEMNTKAQIELLAQSLKEVSA